MCIEDPYPGRIIQAELSALSRPQEEGGAGSVCIEDPYPGRISHARRLDPP